MPTYFPYYGRLYRYGNGYRRNGNGRGYRRKGYQIAKNRYNYRRPYGLPATRGFRTVYGPYKRYAKELKAFDVDLAPAIFQDGPNVTDNSLILLNGLAQGDDYYNRIGREVMIHSVHVKFDGLASATINPNQIVMAKLIW